MSRPNGSRGADKQPWRLASVGAWRAASYKAVDGTIATFFDYTHTDIYEVRARRNHRHAFDVLLASLFHIPVTKNERPPQWAENWFRLQVHLNSVSYV